MAIATVGCSAFGFFAAIESAVTVAVRKGDGVRNGIFRRRKETFFRVFMITSSGETTVCAKTEMESSCFGMGAVFVVC